MKILVCFRQGLDGDINPFDACAYEEALRIKNAEIINKYNSLSNTDKEFFERLLSCLLDSNKE